MGLWSIIAIFGIEETALGDESFLCVPAESNFFNLFF